MQCVVMQLGHYRLLCFSNLKHDGIFALGGNLHFYLKTRNILLPFQKVPLCKIKTHNLLHPRALLNHPRYSDGIQTEKLRAWAKCALFQADVMRHWEMITQTMLFPTPQSRDILLPASSAMREKDKRCARIDSRIKFKRPSLYLDFIQSSSFSREEKKCVPYAAASYSQSSSSWTLLSQRRFLPHHS